MILGFAYNQSDTIRGWNGDFNDGFIVYYTVPGDIMQKRHSMLMNYMSTPIVSIQQVEKIYLGTPFTACVDDPGYTESLCNHKLLIERFCKSCFCYPGTV